MSKSHWDRYREHWARLGPPLRPPPVVVRAYRRLLRGAAERGASEQALVSRALASHSEQPSRASQRTAPERRSEQRSRAPQGSAPLPTLLYGVTPELAALREPLIALDGSLGMIEGVWQGDTEARSARHGDWLSPPLAPSSVEAALGDGALNVVPGSAARRVLLTQLERLLVPGGRAVFRVFVRPVVPEALSAVLATPSTSHSFHAFKWRVAMALASAAPGEVAVSRLYEVLRRAEVEGALRCFAPEAVATLAAYRGSGDVYGFPTEAELAAELPRGLTARWLRVGGYELAERCPLWVIHKAGA